MGLELQLTSEFSPDAAIKADEAITTFGVHLDAGESFVGLGSVRSPTEAFCGPRPQPSIAPAALLPLHDGEPVRADVEWPAHPRGSGQLWPPEAWLSSACDPGRYPLAHAWPMLKTATRLWQWRPHADRPDVVTLDAAQAIAAVYAGVLRGTGGGDAMHTPVLVIPNHLNSTLQQRLLDACAAQGLPARLLWRPIAAAMQWCGRHGAEIIESTPTRVAGSVGHVLVVHLGLDEWETAVLELVIQKNATGVHLIPARPRPRSESTLPSFGFDLAFAMAERFLRRHGDEPSPLALWRLMWTTPWLGWTLAVLRGEAIAEPTVQMTLELQGSFVEGVKQAWGEVCPRLGGLPSSVGNVGDILPTSPGSERFLRWIAVAKEEVSRRSLIGVVVTGPLAGLLQIDGRRFGSQILGRIWQQPQRVLIEGDEMPMGSMANSAAEYSARLAAGFPTYLDTLPHLRTVVSKSGEMLWKDLLKDDDQYVPGGTIWVRQPNFSGLSLKAHTNELTVAIHHEEDPSVREIKAELRNLDVAHKAPVSLAVSIEPAGGNARIEVVPDKLELFGGRRVFVEWKTMRPTGQTPDQWVTAQPRIFPDLLPRHSSSGRWRRSKQDMQSLLAVLEGGGIGIETRLDRVITSLRQKDPTHVGEDYTAVSSEGEVTAPFPTIDPVLRNFVTTLVDSLGTDKRTRLGRIRGDVVRALACTSTSDERFLTFLAARIASQIGRALPEFEDYELAAIGWCVRSAEDAARFALQLKKRMDHSRERSNDWLKALSELLRYRETATQEISSQLCLDLSRHALAVFEAQRQARNLHFLFRNSALIIVYLLRRRAWDDDYLDPESTLALEIKNAFNVAIDDIAQGRAETFQGGTVDIRAALRRMIDYIDRHGSGRILMFD